MQAQHQLEKELNYRGNENISLGELEKIRAGIAANHATAFIQNHSARKKISEKIKEILVLEGWGNNDTVESKTVALMKETGWDLDKIEKIIAKARQYLEKYVK